MNDLFGSWEAGSQKNKGVKSKAWKYKQQTVGAVCFYLVRNE